MISEVAQLYNKATKASDAGQPEEAIFELVRLREFLNDQPELEAGGATEPPTPADQS